jgi:D-alanine transaminase
VENLGYYNGEFGPLEDMKVPMNDRVCWFGDGVYDAALGHKGAVFALDEHIDRFFRSAAMLEMTPPVSKSEIADLINSLSAKVDAETQFVYWQLTRGTALRDHAFPQGAKPNLWVMIKPADLAVNNLPVKLITVEDTRFLHCNIKTLNLLPNVMASEKAKQAGAAEAIFHRNGRVTECAHSNVHILKNGVFQTAPTDNLILPGITRAHLIKLCGKLGIPVKEEPFTLSRLFDADEVMISACTRFCLHASHIDGKPVGGKAPEPLKKLQNGMMEEFLAASK